MKELFRNTSPGALTRAQAVAQQKEKAAAHRRMAENLARQGRDEDTKIAHVARGELVISEVLQNPEVLAAMRRAAAKNDIPFDRLRMAARAIVSIQTTACQSFRFIPDKGFR